jgi:2-keto-3-deoxy-L-rhamnonate aldolase RhmA
MKSNHVRHKLKRGEPSVGTWLTLPDTVAARLMAQTGFDWLTVEFEHTPVTFETAANSFAIIAA